MRFATKIRGPKDILAGAIYIVLGAVLVIWSREYQMGTATRMGPGYYPALLGALLLLFGIAAGLKGLLTKVDNPIPKISGQPLLFLLASVVSFGFLIERAGMVVATFACVFFACIPRLRTNPIEVFLIFVCLATFNYAVFIYAFDMSMPVFWWD